jgi:ubiquinone/menaquinone biosynthesis C-methylase UbiE
MPKPEATMKFFRRSSAEPLPVAMSGVKLGDRLIVIGCSDPLLIAGLASKVGLTGRACAVDADQQKATNAQVIAEREGALVESAAAPGWIVPFGEGDFDVAVIRGVFAETGQAAGTTISEAHRVLRPGGRCVVVAGEARRGLSSLVGGGTAADDQAISRALGAAGFFAVRTLAQREGMTFVEGVKKNS